MYWMPLSKSYSLFFFRTHIEDQPVGSHKSGKPTVFGVFFSGNEADANIPEESTEDTNLEIIFSHYKA